MTDQAVAYHRAHDELNMWASAVTGGTNTAPDLTLRSIIAVREILDRHQPVDIGSEIRCVTCQRKWPCPDETSVLTLLGLPDPEEQQ